MSLLIPDKPFDDNVRQTLCHYVHFFTAPGTADEWIESNPGTFWLPIADAAEVARQQNTAVYPAVVGHRTAR